MEQARPTATRITLAIAGIALVSQAVWILAGGQTALFNLGAVIVIAMLVLSGARWLKWNALTRFALGLLFAGSVADRFGWFGGPGQDGVTWGGWSPFVDYTHSLLPSALESLAPTLAVGATAAEIALAILLILGIGGRVTAAATAALLTIFGLAMLTSLGLDDTAAYAVGVLAAGAAVLATSDTAWRLDRRRAARDGGGSRRLMASRDDPMVANSAAGDPQSPS